MKQLLHESIVFVNKAHKGQLRKGTDIDYVSHPMEVMQLLTSMKADDDLIIAGVLHETVENTHVTMDEIEAKFGSGVVSLISYPEEDKEREWHERKSEIIADLRVADRKVQMLALADKVSNLRSMYGNYLEVGEALWDRFAASKEMQCWYYDELLDVLRDLGEYDDISHVYDEMVSLFKDLFVRYRVDKEAGVLFAISDSKTLILTKGCPEWEATDEEPSVFTEEVSREEAEDMECEWNAIFWNRCEADMQDFDCVLMEDENQFAKISLEDYMLSFEGYDIGLGCNIITGGDEYRYFVTLDETETYEFICQVRMNSGLERDLGELFMEKFGGMDAFTKFMDFCKDKKIKYVFYSV